MEIKIWKDLKEFLNTLNEEQLNQPAIVINAQEESYITIGEAEISDQTYFYNEDSEGIVPIEDYDPEYYDAKPLEDEFNTIVPPGRVFIYEEDLGEDLKS